MRKRILTKGFIIAVVIAVIAAAGLLAACAETTYTVRFDAGGGALLTHKP